MPDINQSPSKRFYQASFHFEHPPEPDVSAESYDLLKKLARTAWDRGGATANPHQSRGHELTIVRLTGMELADIPDAPRFFFRSASFVLIDWLTQTNQAPSLTHAEIETRIGPPEERKWEREIENMRFEFDAMREAAKVDIPINPRSAEQ